MAYIMVKEDGTTAHGARGKEIQYWRNSFYGLPKSYDPQSDSSVKYIKKIIPE